jgi:hypothetical protein
VWIHLILVMVFEGNDHGVTLLMEHRSRVRNLLAILDNIRVMRTEPMSTWSTNRTLHTSRMSVISRYRYVRPRRGLYCLTGLLQEFPFFPGGGHFPTSVLFGRLASKLCH